MFLSGGCFLFVPCCHIRGKLLLGAEAQFLGKAEERVFRAPDGAANPSVLFSRLSRFISAALLKRSPRVSSCRFCPFPGNRSPPAGQTSAHVETNSNGATHVLKSSKGKYSTFMQFKVKVNFIVICYDNKGGCRICSTYSINDTAVQQHKKIIKLF